VNSSPIEDRSPTRVVVLVSCAVILTFAVEARAQEIVPGAATRRELRGTVTDSASRHPIIGAGVQVIGWRVGATTDSLGRFHISAALPPAISVIVRRLGYLPATLRADLSHGSAVLDVALAPRPQTLEGVRVHADSAAQFLRAEQATASMNAEDVQKERGQTLGETIKALPGVSIIQYGPSIAKPVVRGLHSQRIATVNAGVPQEGQQWGGEHAPEIDAFAANEIEVIRGPGTILYGSNALGGVVRVVPRPLPVSGGIGAEISTNVFSNNRQGAGSLFLEGANLRLPAVGALGWRAQVSARRAGDAETPRYYLPNTGFKEIDYNVALGVVRGWGTSEVDFSHFGTDLGL
jgi:iron complex outermembrane receptor protein